MKYLKLYNTETERASDCSDLTNLSLPYVHAIRGDILPIYSGGYIKDGLIFQLDGINKGPNANAWTDLVGGYVFENNGCTATDKGWQITNTTSTYNSLRNYDTLPLSAGNYTTYTIEAVFNTSATRAQILFLPKTADSILFCIGSNKFFYLRPTTSQKLYSTPSQSTISGNNHSVSLNINGGIIDISTSLSQVSNTDYFSVGTYNGIGARSNNANYSFSGNIYAIRIYNRHLTVNEMQHNQQIDKTRFFN